MVTEESREKVEIEEKSEEDKRGGRCPKGTSHWAGDGSFSFLKADRSTSS